MIREIAGRQNHSVKLARKLQKKKHRRERGLLVGEGMDLLRAAVEAGADVRDVLVRERSGGRTASGASRGGSAAGAGTADEAAAVDIGVCDEETLDYASSSGWRGRRDLHLPGAGAGAWPTSRLDEGVTFFLDGVGDPGNVGTLVRSAVAFGRVGLVCSPGTADPYGPKAMRAGMGAQFLLPVVTEVSARTSGETSSPWRREANVCPRYWSRTPTGETTCGRSRPGEELMWFSGAERAGPGAEWVERSTRDHRAEPVRLAQRGHGGHDPCL